MKDKYESLAELKKRVERSRYFAVAVIFIVFATYVWKFVSSNGLHLSGEPVHWGVFGDYVGGLLNPTLAYMAFYWLTQSIVLQKEELSDTRAALERSAKPQESMEENAKKTSKFNVLNAVLQSKNNDISHVRSNIQMLTEQIYSQQYIVLHDGSTTDKNGGINKIQELTAALQLHLNQRDEMIDKINQTLAADV